MTSVSGVPAGRHCQPTVIAHAQGHLRARAGSLRARASGSLRARAGARPAQPPAARAGRAAPARCRRTPRRRPACSPGGRREYAAERFGQQIAVLLRRARPPRPATWAWARCGTTAPTSSSAWSTTTSRSTGPPLAARPDLSRCTLGDLRTVPAARRGPSTSWHCVRCCWTGSSHAELVLDRLTAAIKPGRPAAAADPGPGLRGGLPRPGAARPAARGDLAPAPAGTPRAASGRVRAARRRCAACSPMSLLRGLVIAERQALGGLAGGLRTARPRLPGRAAGWWPGCRGRPADRRPRGIPLRAAQAGEPVRPADLC